MIENKQIKHISLLMSNEQTHTANSPELEQIFE